MTGTGHFVLEATNGVECAVNIEANLVNHVSESGGVIDEDCAATAPQ